MGRNFYWLCDEKEKSAINDDPNIHIDKRSGAGPYCYECGVTLCEGGVTQVHSSKTGWHRECPSCLKKWKI